MDKNEKTTLTSSLILLLSITCGVVVANMYYISLTGPWSAEAVLFIIVNTIGNSVGGLLVPAVKKVFK